MPRNLTITVNVNGESHTREVEVRMLLSDFIRHEIGLTGTHVGCEHGSCGACTILMDGKAIRSCIMLAVQAHGHDLTTIEGIGDPESLHPVQEAFWEAHGLQCGFCTPGIIMTLLPFLESNPSPTDQQIREALSGNLCRCTGYHRIVQAVQIAAQKEPRA